MRDLPLSRQDRVQVERMAEAAGTSASALLPAIVAAYLRLMRDAPAVLPADHMTRLAAATNREKR
ncbi:MULTISPECIES: hypothetical protein [unclassified Sulfitobacter]|uniref:hypothetical protein n=1 Tax=unclassified Sulfitobacter TaxID=196795 RepID=UPI0023E0C60D|nr:MULTISPECIES: hypothetical protein [unclassified Sulfitobacter]MDF3383344.1 hypothetical protein [Sulfitobacter sp. Ks11]MDF3386763.1 hypothetical protein [Sulfitobacter sp. M85]MDF3390182.1 hypothetical protein [Sulfitobacter sp. Ks16]MDF3400819.1 hypothetical protein [Sulfitobacter sp. KE39]MDF3404240.1 hypothetical protein [Sulfitobacter sp. Ks35]